MTFTSQSLSKKSSLTKICFSCQDSGQAWQKHTLSKQTFNFKYMMQIKSRESFGTEHLDSKGCAKTSVQSCITETNQTKNLKGFPFIKNSAAHLHLQGLKLFIRSNSHEGKFRALFSPDCQQHTIYSCFLRYLLVAPA